MLDELNVEAMLNESLNQFKFDSTRFQQAFDIVFHFQPMLNDVFKHPDIWLNKVLNACWNKCWNRLNGPLGNLNATTTATATKTSLENITSFYLRYSRLFQITQLAKKLLIQQRPNW